MAPNAMFLTFDRSPDHSLVTQSGRPHRQCVRALAVVVSMIGDKGWFSNQDRGS